MKTTKFVLTFIFILSSFVLFAQEAGRQQPLKVDERTVLGLKTLAFSRDGSVIDLVRLSLKRLREET